jgi:hypothetical protein
VFLPEEICFLMTRSHQPALDLPDGPPPEVQDEIDAAWERAQVLVDGEFELHFEADELLHRAFGELWRPDGTLARLLTASEALAIACGDPVTRRVPAFAV